MKYLPNPLFEEQFMRSREAAEIVQDASNAIAERAKEIAPVDSGAYRDGIEADGDKVVGTDWKSHLIEWGTARTPTHATLRRAAEQIVGTDNVRATGR